MSKGNKTLHRAKQVKNDEFYTRLTDIEKELKHYKAKFKGKTIFCNCDDPEWSEFWRYFDLNFDFFGLKRVVSTHFERTEPSYKLELYRDAKGVKLKKKTALRQNGDFRSQECIDLMAESDLVITNPPFSLLREYVAQLMEYKKKFVIVANQNAITYKEVFRLIQNNKLWLGCTKPKEFVQPDGSTKKFGNACWFTNLPHKKRNEEIRLFKEYSEEEYTRYDNYDAIEVSSVKSIPKDYPGVMGVPITFLEKYNPSQFSLCGTQRWFYDTSLGVTNGKALVGGKEKYDRVFIKHLRKVEGK